MDFGIGSYTYARMVEKCLNDREAPVSVAKKLALTAAETGLGVVQICDNLPLHQISELELEQLGDYCLRFGVKLQIGTRGLGSEHLLRYLDIASLCGAKLVRTMCRDLYGNDVDVKTAVRDLSEVAGEYEKRGVFIAVENHDKNPSGELADIIRTVSSGNIRLCLDTVNSFAVPETPELVIRNMLPYTINIHLKDFDIVRVNNQMGFSVEGRPLGEGRLKEYIEPLLNSDAHDAIIELWTPFSNDTESMVELEKEWANKSIGFLKNFKV